MRNNMKVSGVLLRSRTHDTIPAIVFAQRKAAGDTTRRCAHLVAGAEKSNRKKKNLDYGPVEIVINRRRRENEKNVVYSPSSSPLSSHLNKTQLSFPSVGFGCFFFSFVRVRYYYKASPRKADDERNNNGKKKNRFVRHSRVSV